MAIDGVSPAAIVVPLFNFALNGIRTAYEVSSVPTEINNHLQTIELVLGSIRTAKRLRREKSRFMDEDELTQVDKAINETERAMAGLDKLVDGARVDMSVKYGAVGAGPRMMWVIRDSSKVPATLTSLQIANQSLHSQIGLMRQIMVTDSISKKEYSSNEPLPTYLQATMKNLEENRAWEARKRPSSVRASPRAEASPRPQSETSRDATPSHETTDDHDEVSASVSNIARYIKENEAMIATSAPAMRRDLPIPVEIASVSTQSSDPMGQVPQRAANASPFSRPRLHQLANPFTALPTSRHESLTSLNSPPTISQTSAATSEPLEKTSKRSSHDYAMYRRSKQQGTGRTTPSMMESTTTIPGSREQILLRWHEDWSAEPGPLVSIPYSTPQADVHNNPDHSATSSQGDQIRIDSTPPFSSNDIADHKDDTNLNTRTSAYHSRPPRRQRQTVTETGLSPTSSTPRRARETDLRQQSFLDLQYERHKAEVEQLRRSHR